MLILFLQKRSTLPVISWISEAFLKIHGREVSLSESMHAELLKERIDGIAKLNVWACSLGPHNRASRGLFYLFERFHLNHRISYPESSYISSIEERLKELACSCVLLTISVDKIEHRLERRASGALAGKSLIRS